MVQQRMHHLCETIFWIWFLFSCLSKTVSGYSIFFLQEIMVYTWIARQWQYFSDMGICMLMYIVLMLKLKSSQAWSWQYFTRNIYSVTAVFWTFGGSFSDLWYLASYAFLSCASLISSCLLATLIDLYS